jgi:hypothetical protein
MGLKVSEASPKDALGRRDEPVRALQKLTGSYGVLFVRMASLHSQTTSFRQVSQIHMAVMAMSDNVPIYGTRSAYRDLSLGRIGWTRRVELSSGKFEFIHHFAQELWLVAETVPRRECASLGQSLRAFPPSVDGFPTSSRLRPSCFQGAPFRTRPVVVLPGSGVQ